MVSGTGRSGVDYRTRLRMETADKTMKRGEVCMLNQEILNRAAAKDVDAMVEVAYAYYNGTDVEEDEAKAFEMFLEILSIDPSQSKVCSTLGNCWFYGLGTSIDKDKGLAYWKHASGMGFAGADTWLGIAYRDGNGVSQDVDRGIAYLKNSAQDGNTRAMTELADSYYFGEVVPKDVEAAKQYYLQAAENGNGYGYNMLGLIAREDGDDDKAFMYYKKGAELKHAYSTFDLGRCYEKGWGTSVDTKAAFEYYKFAADNGIAEAAYHVAATYADGLEGVVPKDQRISLEYMTRAFEGGYSTAGQVLPLYYIHGLGTDVDLEKAAEIAAKGVEMNADVPQLKELCLNNLFDIGYKYYQGDGVEKDINATLRHWVNGAKLGSASCMYAAGQLYEIDESLKDYAKALQFYKMAAEAEHPGAYVKLGILANNGQGMEKDVAQGFQYFKKARELGDESAEGYIVFVLFRNEIDSFDLDVNEEINYAKPKAEAGDADAAFVVYKLMLKDPASDMNDCAVWQKKAMQGGNMTAITTYAGLWAGDIIEKIDADVFIEGCQKALANGEQLPPEVYYALGQSYKEAVGANHDLGLAERYIKMSADSGYVLAMRVLGSEYDSEGAFRHNREASMHYYQMAIDADEDQFSLFFLAVHYLNMNDADTAAGYLSRALNGPNQAIVDKSREVLSEIDRVNQENAYRAAVRESIERRKEAASGSSVSSSNPSSGSQKSGGCYIATAVYGSYDCPEVWTLRRFRDNKLAKTCSGRLFIKTYYAISPKMVHAFGSTRAFNKFWRGRLDKLVLSLKAEGFDDSPYND